MASNENRTHFGISNIQINDLTGRLLAQAELTGAFSGEFAHPLVSSMGGAAAFPRGSRKGRNEGNFTITLNERPAEIESLLHGATLNTSNKSAFTVDVVGDGFASSVAANAKPTLVETSSNGFASRFPDGLSADVYIGITAAGVADVTVVSSLGTREFKGFTLTANNELTDWGLQIGQASTLATGFIRYRVTANVASYQEFDVPQVPSAQEFQVIVWTARGGRTDSQRKWTLNRCVIAAPNITATDNEPSNGIEITGTLLAPDNGGAVYKQEVV